MSFIYFLCFTKYSSFDFFPQPFKKAKPILLLTEEWEAGWIWLIGDSLVTPVLPVVLLLARYQLGLCRGWTASRLGFDPSCLRITRVQFLSLCSLLSWGALLQSYSFSCQSRREVVCCPSRRKPQNKMKLPSHRWPWWSQASGDRLKEGHPKATRFENNTLQKDRRKIFRKRKTFLRIWDQGKNPGARNRSTWGKSQGARDKGTGEGQGM